MASNSSVDAPQPAASAAESAVRLRALPVTLAAGVLLLTAAIAWLGANPWLVGATGAVAAFWMGRRVVAANVVSEGEGTQGAPLLGEVLPVWCRHIESARHHSEESVGGILASFGAISGKLDDAIRMTQAGATEALGRSADEIVRNNEQAVQKLLEPLKEALLDRDKVYAKLDRVSDALTDLRQTSSQIKQLARRINMVALNASVEASRAGDKGSGFAVVAHEVRQLATQSGDAANKMMSRANAIDVELQALRIQAATHDGSDEALRDLADHNARAVIGGLLQSLGDVSRASRDLQEAGAAVHDEFERVLMSFQTQDRLSQILCCVMDDMNKLTDWIAQGGDLGAEQASEWLARLDASYTMEEQRSEHHGNTSIQRETAVEFF